MFRREPGEPARFKRYPYGPLWIRLLTSAAAVVVGLFLVVAHLGVFAGVDQGHATTFYIGLGLIVAGVASALVYRWMAKRGL